MSLMHTGNMIPEITKEEHQGDINAKRVMPVDDSGAYNDKVKIWDGTNTAIVNSDGELYTVNGGHVSTENSSSTPLNAGIAFTGTSVDVLDAAIIIVSVKASHASATNGLSIQFSSDGTNWDWTDDYTIPATKGKTFSAQPQGRYMRIVYTNGGTNQTYFRLQTLIKHANTKPSSHRVQDTILDDDDGELTLNVMKLRTAQDNYVSGAATNSGNFKVSLEEYNGEIATGGLPITTGDSGAVDAFGRFRVSGTGNRLDVEFNYDKQPEIVDEVKAGAGTATHVANSRSVTLANGGTATGDYVGLYTYDVPYTPGSSQLIDVTGTLDLAAIGSGTAQLFLRTKVTGSVEETVVDQADWDTPVLDVAWTKSQIFAMDFQSLKIGRIRFYMNRGGVGTKVHEITNDNIRNTGYWQLASHPVYWRIYNDATYTYMEVGYGDTDNAIGFRYRIAVNASATMSAICATVKSEGGPALLELPGYPRTVSRGVTKKTVSTTEVPLLSIRPKSTFNSITNKGFAIPTNFSVETNNPIILRVYHNCSLVSATWADVDTNESFMEYDTTALGFSNGHKIHAEYVASNRNVAASVGGILGRVPLWYRRGTERGALTITGTKTGTSDGDTLVSMDWEEIR